MTYNVLRAPVLQKTFGEEFLGAEVNARLLAKSKSNSGDEILKKKFLIFVKNRRRKLEGVAGYLKDIVCRLEALEIERSHAFGMCPEGEKNTRSKNNEVDFFERNGSKYVKKFSRSSADKHLDDPENLRPPFFILKTVEYIVKEILDDDTKEES
jgi:hypothetical protein